MSDSIFFVKALAPTDITTVLVKSKSTILSDNMQGLISQKNLPLGIIHLILLHIESSIVGSADIVQS